MKNVLDVLQERGLFEKITSPALRDALNEPVTVYAGFDPTADSLQVGNLAVIMALAHFRQCGHRVVALLGGATALIGDPSGKDTTRPLMLESEVARNVVRIRENISRFLGAEAENPPVVFVNNYDWLGLFTMVEFLREVGRHFRIGAMLDKESVRARLRSESGMSFCEFSYQLLQAYDFLKLYDSHGCVLQIGGSDQWGNITAGIELIRKLRGAEAFGLILPLVCDSEGRKFGKSEAGAVFLDASRTSCYSFYQFFVRTADADVIRFLKIYTMLPMEEIAELEKEVKLAPESRAAQKKLAEEVTRLAHGEEGLRTAERATAVLFGAPISGLSSGDLLEIFSSVPSASLRGEYVRAATVVDVAAASGLCGSKSEARRLIESGGLYVNNRRVDALDARIGEADIIDGRVLVLRAGKKNYLLVKVA